MCAFKHFYKRNTCEFSTIKNTCLLFQCLSHMKDCLAEHFQSHNCSVFTNQNGWLIGNFPKGRSAKYDKHFQDKVDICALPWFYFIVKSNLNNIYMYMVRNLQHNYPPFGRFLKVLQVFLVTLTIHRLSSAFIALKLLLAPNLLMWLWWVKIPDRVVLSPLEGHSFLEEIQTLQGLQQGLPRLNQHDICIPVF